MTPFSSKKTFRGDFESVMEREVFEVSEMTLVQIKTSSSYCVASPIVYLLKTTYFDKEKDKQSVQVMVQSTNRKPDPEVTERGLPKAQTND